MAGDSVTFHVAQETKGECEVCLTDDVDE